MGRYTLKVTGSELASARAALAAADGIHGADESEGAVVISVDAPSGAEAVAFARGKLPPGDYEVARPAPLDDDSEE